MPLTVKKTGIEDLLVLSSPVYRDERGLFCEVYKASEFRLAGIKVRFDQDNRSVSRKNVLRGLHFQRAPRAQAKLVRCARGRIYDVAVDLRRGSRTFGQSYGLELSGENGLQLFIPAGFAHGFCALTDGAELSYKCSREYSPEHDAGVRWDDPDLAVKWPCRRPIISPKDAALPPLRDVRF